MVTSLANAIVKKEMVPEDRNESVIVNCCKGKGDTMDRENYRGLKLLDQVMKAVERIFEMIRDRVSIHEMQFDFMPGKGTTKVIFVVRQLQENIWENIENSAWCLSIYCREGF